MSRRALFGVVCVILLGLRATAAESKRPYRLPSVDIRERVIWGAACELPGGGGLAFGGQDQLSDDGRPHTRVKRNGEWTAIRGSLRAANPLQPLYDRAIELRDRQRFAAARARFTYFKGIDADAVAERARGESLLLLNRQIGSGLEKLLADLNDAKRTSPLSPYQSDQAARAIDAIKAAAESAAALPPEATPDSVRALSAGAIRTDQAAELLDAEPPARALSPIVYDPKTRLFVLFGGDHCDYLTNDTWVFDPKEQQWEQRHPPAAPPPRANHELKANGDGTVTLTGGYTYFSNTDYCGGQYVDIGDGPWTYDVAANRWTGTGEAAEDDARVYRTGPFLPEYFLEGPKPDPAAHEKRLSDLPPNTWVAMEPPLLPHLNRDWGSATLDPDRDLILRFSGGHSAHGGTDVLHYHLSTNRWELPFPVEFPLGQLYSNTSYPEGYNFNRRPWVTGHTYQNYGYDPVLKKMLFAGQKTHTYVYDPTTADWVGRFAKPEGMVYNSCFYTITICPTPRCTECWTAAGQLYRFDAERYQWVRREYMGEELPGAVVDNSTLAYDSKRDRLLFWRKPYGRDHAYDGQIYAFERKDLRVTTLSPEGMAGAGAIPYLCQIRYDERHDLMLVGATLPPDADGFRRTPAYDCEKNRWISLRITGDDPHGEKGRNVSLGMMYDTKRGLFWAVDTNSRVFALRLDPETADVRPLE